MSPSWIETIEGVKHSNEDMLQHPVKRVGKVSDISNMAMFYVVRKQVLLQAKIFQFMVV